MNQAMLEASSFHPHDASAGHPDDPWSEAMKSWDAVRPSAMVQRVRWHAGMSQSDFADAFHIDLAQLRHLESGAVQPDSALVAYLTVIDRAPQVVRMILAAF